MLDAATATPHTDGAAPHQENAMSPTDDLSITEAWIRPVEQLVLPALESRIRVLGLTSPEVGAGVTTLCHAAAETLARSGVKVLLIDFTGALQDGDPERVWVPGEQGAGAFVQRHPGGYDVLTAVVTEATRFLFNNGKRLRRTLFEDLSEYSTIVVDLPPLLGHRTDGINPVAPGLVCDQVLLVCANERTTRSSARAAVDAGKTAGLKLAGAVWNNFGAPPLGRDMARSARKSLWIMPGLARYIERRLARSPFLNS